MEPSIIASPSPLIATRPLPLDDPGPALSPRSKKSTLRRKDGTERIGTMQRRKKNKNPQRRGSTATIETSKGTGSHLFASESMGSLPILLTDSHSADRLDTRHGKLRRASNLEMRALKEEQNKENERTAKWHKMFKQWDIFRTKRKDVLKTRILKGIPDMWRGRAWIALLNPESEDDRIATNDTGGNFRRRQLPKYYFDKAVPPNDAEIQADVEEIITRSGIVVHESTSSRLYTILRAYANIAAETGGYRRGMGYIAAWLVEYSADDYEVFWAFVRAMKGKIGLEKFYAEDGKKMDELLLVWRRVVAAHFPRVEKNMAEQKVDDRVYAPEFFLHAFMRLPLPTVLKRRIMDRFCFFGMRALLGLGIAFISLQKETLATVEAMDIVSILQAVNGDDWMTVIQVWNKNWVDKNEYVNALAKCHATWK